MPELTKDQIQLSPEAARYLEERLLDFARDGLQLEGEKREKLIELNDLSATASGGHWIGSPMASR